MNRLKELRGKDSQQKIAEKFGITQRTYSNYESGKSQIPDDLKIVFAEYFGVTVDYLLGREEKSPPENQEDKGLYIPEKYRDVMVAFSGGTDDLTQEDIDAIVSFIEFTKNNKKK